MDDLHKSQIQAYRLAATEAVQSWAMAVPLEPMEEHDTEESFVDRCVSALAFGKRRTGGSSSSTSSWSSIPNWKLDNIEELASDEIRKRAKAVYEKYHPAEEIGEVDMARDAATEGVLEDDLPTADEDDDEHHEGEEDDEESREEDGELDKHEGIAVGSATGATTDATKQNPNGRNTNRNNRKGGTTNTTSEATPVKKKAPIKRTYRGNRSQASRGGRRGGRGGGGNVRS
jgi:hypothetical protein